MISALSSPLMMSMVLQSHRDNFHQRDWYGSTFLHPMGATAIILLGTLTIILPRKYAAIPLIVLINFIPCTQRIAIAGADFNLLRIMILFGWARMFMKGEIQALKLVKLDKLLLAWAVSETVIYVLQFRTVGAAITYCGRMMEAVGGYFMIRCFIQNWDDVFALAKAIAVIAIPVGIFFVIEKSTGRNYFSVFGGVPEYTWAREGKLRAMGAITNPILAGCLWASYTQLIGALFFNPSTRLLSIVGVICSVFVVFACASSTPLAALMASGLGAYLFKYRYYMPEIRKGVLQVLLILHVLKMSRGKPVWHLLSRIDLVGGSTGWHRYHLIDQFLHRIPEWGILGTRSTAHWGWGLWDITNHYVFVGVRGGLLALFFFVWMVIVVFKYMGPIWRSVEHDGPKVAMAWAMGGSLFVHCCAFIAVTYFGQMIICWYMSLAIVGSLYQYVLKQQAEGEEDTGAEKPVEAMVPVPRRRRRKRLIGVA